MEIKEQDNIPYSEKRIGNETQFAVDLRRDIIDLVVLMETYLNHAPRCERYCLCARIRDIGVQMCERMAEIRIAPSKSKEGYIKKLCYDIEKYRALNEVFRMKGYFTFKRGVKESFTNVEAVKRAGHVETRLSNISRKTYYWIQNPAY